LDACGAVAALAPELAVTHGVSGLARAAKTTRRPDCRWAALLSDLSEARATDLSKRLKAPNAHTLLAARVCRWRPQMKSALRDPATCMALLSGLDALRREEPFRGFCETLVSLENNAASANSAVDALSEARKAAQLIKAADFSSTHLEGPALGMAIREAQIEQITGVLSRLIQGR
ncbi:MAG: tRNA nucleotidyltransferase, partial [Halieaceae bacterium]